jgi:nitrite reductase/ring-hydroxylating ferredoxin subunit
MGGPELAPQAPQRSGSPGEAGAPLDIPGFVPVTRASDLSPGAMTWVALERERVLVVNVDGAFYALKDACGHRQAPLSKGVLEGHVIECPLHFAQFDVRTGELLSGPIAEPVPTYQVRVEGDTVYVKR